MLALVTEGGAGIIVASPLSKVMIQSFLLIRQLDASPVMSMPTLVALGRGWTPEEAARHEVALFRALASDKKALRVYLKKVRIVEMARRQQVNPSPCPSATKDLDIGAAAGPDRRTSGAGRPTDAAAEPRVRRRKSEAQRSKSVQKLRRKKAAGPLRGCSGEGGR